MPAFKGDKSLRDSTARFLMACFHVLNDGYGKIVNMEEVAPENKEGI